MINNIKIKVLFMALFVIIGNISFAAGGSGDITIGYTVIDEEGDPSVNLSTFNEYEGFALSLEKFHYPFANGIHLYANLRNITLNNRNLSLGLRKPGLFGIKLANNQYRRKYDADGVNFTRRHQTSGSIWYYPIHSLKLFIDGNYTGKSGKMTNLIEPEIFPIANKVDYQQSDYNFGFRYNDKGRMLQAEYRTVSFDDDINQNSDRSGKRFRITAQTPIPSYEKITVTAGYQNFESKFKTTDYKLTSDRGWGGIKYNLPHNFYLNYNFIYDRTGSNSDVVETDNLAHTIYLTHIWSGLAGLTGGYQNSINDDYNGEINSDAFYFSGWLRPSASLEFRGEYGNRAEKVTDGYRLTGREDRSRYKFSLRFHEAGKGSIRLGYENRQRKNESLSIDTDFGRFSAAGNLILPFGNINAGYSYALGEYENVEQEFKFDSHVLYGSLKLNEYKGISLGLGGVYYRSQQNLNAESFNLNFNVSYKFLADYTFETVYNIDNFDNYLELDQYYTSNIIEINLIKYTSF